MGGRIYALCLGLILITGAVATIGYLGLSSQGLLAGSIFENIMGPHQGSLQETWHAAEIASIADDIRAMPMGMHTVLPGAALADCPYVRRAPADGGAG